MKAVAYDRYGLPDVLTIEDVPVPVTRPGPGARQAGRDVGEGRALGKVVGQIA